MMISVLLVERDAAVARLYREELAEAGFVVRVLPDLDAALADLRLRPAQVLVTDRDTVGQRLRAWLPQARQVHDGPVVVLGPLREDREEDGQDLALVPKSSDLSPLIHSLRGQALRLLWSSAVAPAC